MKAKVIRGVFIRGTPYPEGAIVELSKHEFAELKNTNYVVEAPAELERRIVKPREDLPEVKTR